MRNDPKLFTDDTPSGVAEEIARVGILPSHQLDPIGSIRVLAGQPFRVTGYATREELLEAVRREGLPEPEAFALIPGDIHFLRVSTD